MKLIYLFLSMLLFSCSKPQIKESINFEIISDTIVTTKQLRTGCAVWQNGFISVSKIDSIHYQVIYSVKKPVK